MPFIDDAIQARRSLIKLC